MKITQKHKILDIFNGIQKAHALFFVSAAKLNAWEVKKDRQIFLNKNIFTYKANTYRSVQLFKNIPIFRPLAQSIFGPFFIATCDEQKDYKALLDIFDTKTQYMKVFLAVQNSTFFSKNRILLAETAAKKNMISWPLAMNPFYFLYQSLYYFLLNSVRCNLQIQNNNILLK